MSRRENTIRRLAAFSPKRFSQWYEFQRLLLHYRKHLKQRLPHKGNRVRLLHAGREAFDGMEALIVEARHHVHVEMYTIGPDVVGKRMLAALEAAALRGVEVRLVYDAIGSIELPSSMLRPLRKAGGDVRVFNSFQWFNLATNINRRNHRKQLIADGKVAILGGINWTTQFAEEKDGGEAWSDLAVQIEGPVVNKISLFFWNTWLRVEGEIPELLPPYFPKVPRKGRAIVLPRASRRLLGQPTFFSALLRAIEVARHDVEFLHSYFIPNRHIRKVLAHAVRRGVRVRAIQPKDTDVAVTKYASEYQFARLLRMGVELFLHVGPMLHTKAVVIDDRLTFIGSSNLDHRSVWLSLELSVEVLDRRLAREVRALCEVSAEESEEVTLLVVRGWSPWRRFKQWVCHYFRYFI